jgi:DNA-damage-inducible protein J
MAKDAIVRARTDLNLKTQVDRILDKIGLNTTTAINIFYKQILLNKGMPFDVRIPNKETKKAIKDAEKKRGKSRFKTADSLLKSLKS